MVDPGWTIYTYSLAKKERFRLGPVRVHLWTWKVWRLVPYGRDNRTDLISKGTACSEMIARRSAKQRIDSLAGPTTSLKEPGASVLG